MRVFVTGIAGFSGSAPAWPEMAAITQLAVTPLNVNQARCEALFVSDLQPTDAPTAGMVAEAIGCTVRRFGVRGCAGRMAQEFGDHPDVAATRMRWVRHLAGATARPQASPGAQPADGLLPNARARAAPPCRTDAPVREGRTGPRPLPGAARPSPVPSPSFRPPDSEDGHVRFPGAGQRCRSRH
jgi:hypothetical protein